MADITRTVETIFSVADRSTKPLLAMAGATSKVTGLLDRASEKLGSFGTIATVASGLFAFKHAITTTQEFLSNVKKIKDSTGMASGEAGGLLDAMSDVGIESGEAVNMFAKMGLISKRVGMSMSGIGNSVGGVSREYQRLGLVGKPVEQQFFQLAKLAKNHKLTQQDLQVLYRQSPEAANKLMKVLKQGPTAIQKQVEEFKKLGIATDENLRLNSEIKKSQYLIAGAWEKIQMVIAVRLLPVLAEMMEYVKENMEGWIDSAKEFGEILKTVISGNFGKILSVVKLVLANLALIKVTGKGLGGWLQDAFKAAMKPLIAGRTAAAAEAAMEMGMAAPVGAATMGKAGGGAMAASLLASGPVIIAIVAAIAVIALAVTAWKKDVESMRGQLKFGWVEIKYQVEEIGNSLTRALAPIMKVFGIKGTAGYFFLVIMSRAIIGMLKNTERVLMFGRLIGRLFSLAYDSAIEIGSAIATAIGNFASSIGNFFDSAVIPRMNYAWLKVVEAFNTWVADPIIKAWPFIKRSFDELLITPLKESWAWLFTQFLEPIIAVVSKIAEAFNTYMVKPITGFFQKIFSMLEPYLKRLGAASGGVGDIISKISPTSAAKGMVGAYTSVMKAPINIISREWAKLRAESTEGVKGMLGQEAIDKAMAAKKKALEQEERDEKNFNFQGSHFSITQKFAEGFDPDRIAAAFTNDLATLGERKLQSGFAPVFSVR